MSFDENYNIEQTKKIIHRNNCVIYVNNIGKKSAIINLPKNVDIVIQEPSTIKMTQLTDGVKVEYKIGKHKEHLIIKCEKYATPIIMMTLIIKECMIRGYNYSFVDFFLNKKQVMDNEFFENFATDLSTDESEKLSSLSKIVTKMVLYGQDDNDRKIAKNKNVIEEFKIIDNILNHPEIPVGEKI